MRETIIMNLLHINSYFETNEVHRLLVERLSKEQTLLQWVYVPLAVGEKLPENQADWCSAVNVHYAHVFHSWQRFLWPWKMFLLLKGLLKYIRDINTKIDLVHAHTLITNGLLAYIICKVWGIPYVITVRNTDVNVFLKRSVLFRALGRLVLEEAKFVIVPNLAYGRIHLPSYLGQSYMDGLAERLTVIPNGVDDFWLNNRRTQPRSMRTNGQISVGFIGRLDKNKNIERLIEAASVLDVRGLSVKLHVVGDGPLLRVIEEMNLSFDMKVHGKLSEKDKLLELMEDIDVLAVPSLTESFGVVYVEAMSQGIPIVYSRNEGFDGFFAQGEVGYAVNALDVNDIADKIEMICRDYGSLSNRALHRACRFDWNGIAGQWLTVYRGVCSGLV